MFVSNRKQAADLTGKVVGRLTVLRRATSLVGGQKGWVCICVCGTEHNVRHDHLVHEFIRSCGCYQSEVSSKTISLLSTTHGMSGSREHNSWNAMRARCYRPNRVTRTNYHGKGITVCVRWRESFENFLVDMGYAPTQKHTVDRINSDKGYWCGKPECPDCGPPNREPNCRWATSKEQNRNRRDNVNFTVGLQTMCVAAWAELLGVPPETLWGRLKRGWPVDKAMTQPPRKWSGRRKALHALAGDEPTEHDRTGEEKSPK